MIENETTKFKMIKEASVDNFETERSLNQDLTFATAEKFFAERGIAFEDEQKRSLGIISSDGTFSNLGLLLSEQCMHTIKFAAFEGITKTIFRDRKEFTGSLLAQLEDAYNTLMMFNHIHADFVGLRRVDCFDYPIEAVREALLNAIIHREYSFSASTLISLFEDRMEFVTIGGLPKGITKNDIMLGISNPRNRNLADVFYRLHLIEAYGTGLLKIKECYRNSNTQPTIQVSDNAFKITLPNLNAKGGDNDRTDKELLTKEDLVISYLERNNTIRRSEVQKLLGCSQTAAITTLTELVKKGKVVREGSGSKIRYNLL